MQNDPLGSHLSRRSSTAPYDVRWPPGGDAEHSGHWQCVTGSGQQWRSCWPQWALWEQERGGMVEQATGGVCEQRRVQLPYHPADGDSGGGKGRLPPSSQEMRDRGRGTALTQGPADGMVEQVSEWHQAKVGSQVGLRGCEAGGMSWGLISIGYPERSLPDSVHIFIHWTSSIS